MVKGSLKSIRHKIVKIRHGRWRWENYRLLELLQGVRDRGVQHSIHALGLELSRQTVRLGEGKAVHVIVSWGDGRGVR
jgi:hypothetical protein